MGPFLSDAEESVEPGREAETSHVQIVCVLVLAYNFIAIANPVFKDNEQ